MAVVGAVEPLLVVPSLSNAPRVEVTGVTARDEPAVAYPA
jgi:hypothetical protein